HLERAERAVGQHRIRDPRRERARSRRLLLDRREPRLQPWPDDEDSHRPGARRPPRRARRELLRRPLPPRQREDRPRPGPRDDQGRRRSTASPCAHATATSAAAATTGGPPRRSLLTPGRNARDDSADAQVAPRAESALLQPPALSQGTEDP